MRITTLLHLTDLHRQDLLTAAARTNDAEYRDACRAILLLGSGHPRAEVAKHFGVHPTTIGRWAAAFLFNSLDDLAENVQRGIDELNATVNQVG